MEKRATFTREEYDNYINSPAWRAMRQKYWDSKLPNDCYCCGTPRHPGMHIHHKTYKRFGNEYLMDLIPVCQDCHDKIHDLHRNHNPRGRHLWGAAKRVKNLNQREGNYRECGWDLMQSKPTRWQKKMRELEDKRNESKK